MKSTFNFNRPYVRNEGKSFAPIYCPGERYSIYLNFSDIPPNTFGAYSLNIIDSHTNTLVKFVSGVKLLYVAANTYHLYNENFVFPLIRDGQYYFQIYNLLSKKEACRSNIIEVNSKSLDSTSYIEYRHNDQIYGIRYDLIPNFYMKFRLPINEVESIDISSTREQYREASNKRDLMNTKSFRDIKQKLEMYWANAEDFEAISAMLEHSDIKINGSKLIPLDQIKVELPSFASVQYKGIFTVIVRDENVVNGYRADKILRGGTTFNKYKNISKGGVL